MDIKEKNSVISEIDDIQDIDNISEEELSLEDEDEASGDGSKHRKKLPKWKLKLLIWANKPMSKLDAVLEFFGGLFEPLFCGIIPLLVMTLVSYNIFKDRPEFASGLQYPLPTIITFGVMIPILMFLPKFASAIEFITLGTFILLMKSTLLLKYYPEICSQIDPHGYYTAGPTSGGILGMAALGCAVLLLLGKTVFFCYFKLKKYRRKYLKRKHGRKKEKRHVASLDSSGEVLM